MAKGIGRTPKGNLIEMIFTTILFLNMNIFYKISIFIYIIISVLSYFQENYSEIYSFYIALYISFLVIYIVIIQDIQPHHTYLYKHLIDIIAFIYYREYALMIMMSYQMFELIWQYSEYSYLNSKNPQVPF